jgi:hypothetical protein
LVGGAEWLDGEVVEQGLHLAGGVRVAGALGGGEPLVEEGDGLFAAAVAGEGLGGHLKGGDVVGVVHEDEGELGEGGVGVALVEVLHGEAVAGEGVGGVELEDSVQCGDLVHGVMVRVGGREWQVSRAWRGVSEIGGTPPTIARR